MDTFAHEHTIMACFIRMYTCTNALHSTVGMLRILRGSGIREIDRRRQGQLTL